MYQFHITPKTEEELTDLLAKGRYKFYILKSTYHQKENYVQMIWKLKLWDSDGKERLFTQFFKVDQSSNFCMRMLRHALYSIGCGDLWEKGKWNAEDFDHGGGYLMMDIQKAGKGRDGNWYEAKNIIRDFITDNVDKDLEAAANSLPSKQAPATEKFDDDIPF